MRFLSNTGLAFAVISGSLLSITIAVPTPKMVILGSQVGRSTVEIRQCTMTHCADDVSNKESSPLMSRQLLSHPADEEDIADRQTTLSLGAEEGNVLESRLIGGGLMVEKGDFESRQIMSASSADEGDVQNRQIHGGFMAEEGDVENRQLSVFDQLSN